jgi:phage shock protein C
MFCTQCGTKLDETARYCISCGKPVDAVPHLPYADAAPPRKLRRIRADKKIAGVCAGFAEYFDMDVTLMRLIWVALTLLPPAVGLIAYVVAWIVLPAS